jgi:hypothetical protein
MASAAAGARAQLTTLITSPSDLKRARRELESVDEFMVQAGMRTGGKAIKMPQTSRLVDELVDEAKANLLHKTDRERILKYLTDIIEHAPVLHISFASEPSAAFVTKLVVWLRGNIHPHVLVRIGLQPSIAAGCIVRSTNQQFDFSLTKSFEEKRGLLLEGLKIDPNAATPDEAKRIEAAALKEAAAHQAAEGKPA